MIPTPDLSHLTSEDFEDVYEPAEDTFLLLDALEQDEEALKRSNPIICLEIGSGSGCVSSFIGKILGNAVLYLCTDINIRACNATLATGIRNQIALNTIHASLASPLHLRLAHSVDIIVFNPPYVPTTSNEALDAQGHHDITGAWAGGTDGMQITNQFLGRVDELLSTNGRFYLVALKQNGIPEIMEQMEREHGLHGEVVLQRRAGREHLFVLRFMRM
ncbi:S-adenosyl-L-methionine-dependent methyltransferase [Cyathus striatus]|nr:S-adenosyl-L-methionine-dependent methyltransferase [Cyathus striatus]